MQVLLVWPHQMALIGITPGLICMMASGVFSSWTMWLLVVLYMQRKQLLVSCSYLAEHHFASSALDTPFQGRNCEQLMQLTSSQLFAWDPDAGLGDSCWEKCQMLMRACARLVQITKPLCIQMHVRPIWKLVPSIVLQHTCWI